MSEVPTLLTHEQKMRMDESRQRALEKRKMAKVPVLKSVIQEPPAKKVPIPIRRQGAFIKLDFKLLSKSRFRVDMNRHDNSIHQTFKTIQTGHFQLQSRVWSFSIDSHDEVIKKLQGHSVNEINPLPSWILQSFLKSKPSPDNLENEMIARIEPTLFTSLMPFQLDGIRYSIKREGRVLIADDMGLALGVASFYSEEWPLLIVAPSSVKFNWKSSVLRWIPSVGESDIIICSSSSRDTIRNEKIVVISYDLISRKCSDLEAKSFKVAIMDESHLLKNFKSIRCQSTVKILQRTKKNYFTKWNSQYGMRYCGGKKISLGRDTKAFFDFNGSSNMEELNLLLTERCMIRRLKSDVLKELPSKQRQMIVLDPSSVKSGSKIMKQQAQNMLSKSNSTLERKAALLEWFNTTSIAKEKAVQEYIKDLLESHHKFIVFAHHQSMIKCLQKLFEKESVGYVTIEGKTSSDNRKVFVDRFQTVDDCRVAVLSITSASAGITLTAANLVIFAELFWNPGILTQAEDRVHRIGQTDSVIIQYLVAKGTADDELWSLVQKKLEVLNQAGLSKDNFLDASTSSKQIKTEKPKITDYFSSSFTENDFEELFTTDF
ncbi:SMARCAL1 [Lepeophtheirus salmonis]|uniref:SMARCAL1 n=1 Tax=Lepeophtheirus salmonis TaxID=72036 RepID=A0A7R8H5M5_LEPSM|nr:SMARCAL1 [Lepeophtheirus salmonis]CAF2883363.1 SMARCAL1 [Lepeophtheirus salmonis]